MKLFFAAFLDILLQTTTFFAPLENNERRAWALCLGAFLFPGAAARSGSERGPDRKQRRHKYRTGPGAPDIITPLATF
jgi:hypothetical protein